MIVRHVKYVCEPRVINVEVDFPVSSRHVILTIKLNNKAAYTRKYLLQDYPTKKNEYDLIVAIFCSNFINFTKDELDYYTTDEEYMLALNAHKNLNKVLHKSGNIVWTRH